MTIEEIKALDKKESPPETPKEKEGYDAKYAENRKTLDQAKTELEMKRLQFEEAKLDAEMKKFSTPSTNIDYYGKMLDMQNSFNQQLLSMQKENFQTQILLAKLESGKSDQTALWMDFLEPYIPSLLARLGGGAIKEENQIYVHNDKGEVVLNPRLAKSSGNQQNVVPSQAQEGVLPAKVADDKESAFTAPLPVKNIEEEDEITRTKRLIREGKMSIEEAWKEMQDNVNNPEIPSITRKMMGAISKEDFEIMYHNIKEGKI